MYKPITRGLRVQDQPWVHNKSACSCGVCTREARQSISKKLHINPRPCGSKAYLGRRSLHVLMRWKRKERGWDQFERLQKSLSNGSIGMKDDNRDWREPWTRHSLDRKRRGDPFNKRNRFGVSITGSPPTHHIHILGFIHFHPDRPSRADSPARGRYGVILPLYTCICLFHNCFPHGLDKLFLQH